jgi:putative ABC transport system ATP-binding protein
MLEIRNISKEFSNKTIVKNFNYIFNPGKIYTLNGESGSGKTTLINLISKLDTLNNGEILFNDTDIETINDTWYFKNVIGYLFQNYALIEEKSVDSNLKLVKSNKEQRLNALIQAHLDESYLKRKIFSLSGGEMQRVAMARLILKGGEIILADEPTSALDENNAEIIMNIFKDFAYQQNKTVIISTHDQFVINNSDEVINISDFR